MPSCFLLDESRTTIGVIQQPGCDPSGHRKEARLVGLILVSHSGTLVDGLREMVVQVAGPDVAVATAGGTEDGRLGTSAPRIAEAVRDVLDRADTAVVLLDLGSAALSLELALEDLSEEDRRRVHISEAPLVEGAILAAVQASVGATVDEVVAAAQSATTMAKLPRA